ncbi:MAG: glycosyltransferase, partial [Thermoplasmatales archaeon]
MITYIIPAMNEEATIGGVIDSIREIDKEGEIIVVDSDSTDRTAEIARSKGAIVVNERIKGYGYAYKRGFMAAKGDIICTL